MKNKPILPTLYSRKLDTTDKIDSIVGVYAHGELNKILGTDILMVNVHDEKKLIPGVHYIRVHSISVMCIAFLWSTREHMKRGLIVLSNDTENLKYANEKYKEKSPVL